MKGDKVKYCLELDRPLHEQVRALARRKHYPMAAIFRDGVKLILDRDRVVEHAVQRVRSDLFPAEEATK